MLITLPLADTATVALGYLDKPVTSLWHRNASNVTYSGFQPYSYEGIRASLDRVVEHVSLYRVSRRHGPRTCFSWPLSQ